MILPFSTQINGKPTYFVEKIWASILKNSIQFKAAEMKIGIQCEEKGFCLDDAVNGKLTPKLHTIRKDENNRWKEGNVIDFYINSRTRDMFQFAPRIPVVSTQEIDIYHHLGRVEIRVESKLLTDSEIEKLAINDGFESIGDFFAYFNEDFTGKIIHWTDFKYNENY